MGSTESFFPRIDNRNVLTLRYRGLPALVLAVPVIMYKLYSGGYDLGWIVILNLIILILFVILVDFALLNRSMLQVDKWGFSLGWGKWRKIVRWDEITTVKTSLFGMRIRTREVSVSLDSIIYYSDEDRMKLADIFAKSIPREIDASDLVRRMRGRAQRDQ